MQYNLKVYIFTVLAQILGAAAGVSFSRLGYQGLEKGNKVIELFPAGYA